MTGERVLKTQSKSKSRVPTLHQPLPAALFSVYKQSLKLVASILIIKQTSLQNYQSLPETAVFFSAFATLPPESVEHRAVKYLNNLIEQDHRYTKLRVVTSQNFRNFWSASRTISGYESMNMIRKGQHRERWRGFLAISRGQIKDVQGDDILSQIKFIHSLFGIAV